MRFAWWPMELAAAFAAIGPVLYVVTQSMLAFYLAPLFFLPMVAVMLHQRRVTRRRGVVDADLEFPPFDAWMSPN